MEQIRPAATKEFGEKRWLWGVVWCDSLEARGLPYLMVFVGLTRWEQRRCEAVYAICIQKHGVSCRENNLG